MSVGLAWRLVWSGIASEEDIEAALRQQLLGGLPFVRALLLGSPSVARVLEHELPPVEAELSVDRDLASRLPDNAAATFLAIPIGRDPASGVVVVAAADPLDRHVAHELAFHLGEPVRLVPASLDRLLAELPAPVFSREDRAPRPEVAPPPPWRPPPAPAAEAPVAEVPRTRAQHPTPARRGTPAHGTPALPVSHAPAPSTHGTPALPASHAPAPAIARPSEPPIPLIRVNPAPASRMVSLGPSPRATEEPVDEPVLSLTRPKTSSKPASEPSPPPEPAAAVDLDAALEAIRAAESADEIVAALVAGAAPLARSVVVFATRGNVFAGRDGAGRVDAGRVRALQIPLDRPSVLRTASELGHYLGPIPQTDVHRDLTDLLEDPKADVSVHAAMVGGKPAIAVLLAGIANSYAATGTGEQLARAAGRALETLVRARKK